ncbi:BRO family protein [Streptococcus sp. ZY19097]|uniref:BRO-N domain-containing protein n=1 Tax=Streptococcus sp. ZY19097 TaxID=3231906 RepID=UPI00345A7F3B
MRRNYSSYLDDFCTTYRLSGAQVARMVGMAEETIQAIRRGERKPQQATKDKLNRFILNYKKENQPMTPTTSQETQRTTVDPFEDFYDWSKGKIKKPTTKVITTQQFGSKSFEIYGDKDNPLFIAVEVAKMIEVQNTTDLLKRVDEDEKLTYVITRAGQKREVNMLTEFGLYEVLFQSRKPKAKEFKKVVKNVLKEIRLNGYYMNGELINKEHTQPVTPMQTDDLAYIKNKLNELQANANTLVEVHEGLQRVNNIILALVNPLKKQSNSKSV